MKFTHSSLLRGLVCGMALLIAVVANAANITVDGINYSTSKTNATVAKYTVKPDTVKYSGVINIPETFEYNGVEYTVVAVAANAFLDCTEVTEIHLPATCVTINRYAFRGCTNLTNFPVPETAVTVGSGVIWGCKNITEAFVPGGITGENKNAMISNEFAETGVKKLTFMPSDDVLLFTKGALGSATVMAPIEEIVLLRNVQIRGGDGYSDAPFRNLSTLKKVTIGGKATDIPSDWFINCTNLEEVIFENDNKIESIGGSAFSGCTSLKNITVPATITAVPNSLFYNCSSLEEVNFLGEITSIGQYAFNNTKALTSFTMPATLTTIGISAFAKSGLTGVVEIPEGVTSIGSEAFAQANKITGFKLPATLATIGNAAFAPINKLAAIELAEGNSAFKVTDNVLTNAAGNRLLVVAHQAEGLPTEINLATVESIDNYGMALTPYTDVNFPNLNTIGNYGFYKAAIKEFTYKAGMTVNPNAFLESELEILNTEEGAREIPQNLCANCTKLTTVNISNTVTNMFQDAFAGCTALEHMTLGANINYMEKGSVPATIKSLTVRNAVPPVLGAGVFEPSQSDVNCHVAMTSVEDYKAANQWQYLNIIGDPDIAADETNLGCPGGLYFATKDNRLLYLDKDGEIQDTELSIGEHSFNIQNYKNRIYVASAGHYFTYQDAAAQANGGDGEVVYVNKTNDLWYRVTVLNNVGYKAFEDPFSMYIEEGANKIYIADRNVGIHEMDADTVGLYGTQPFFMENNWTPYYDDKISYGAIGAGMTLRLTDVVSKEGETRNNVYWVAKKFNGVGIMRFTKDMLYSDGKGSTHQDKQLPWLLGNLQMTSFYVDETNGYLYFYLQKDGTGTGAVPGVYRMPLSVIAEKQDEATIKDALLIDDAPVLLEGSGDEITGVTQITGDGEKIYWAYISAGNGTAVPNSVAYDETNPTHKTGIKFINAVVEDATVAPQIQYAVEGIAAYGVTVSAFDEPGPQPLTGDVNQDGSINAADVTALYNYILNGDSTFLSTSDVNGDGAINAGDVTAVYNIILGL